MKSKMSWRTTVAGIVSIAGGVVLLVMSRDADNSVIAGVMIASGLGLIGARDHGQGGGK